MNQPNSKNTAETNRVAYLVCAFIADSISKEEHIELNHWLDDDQKNCALFEAVTMLGAPVNRQAIDWKQRQ